MIATTLLHIDTLSDMTADYLIGIGTVIAAIAAVVSAYATVMGNRRVKKVQGHLDNQDRALGIGETPDALGDE